MANNDERHRNTAQHLDVSVDPGVWYWILCSHAVTDEPCFSLIHASQCSKQLPRARVSSAVMDKSEAILSATFQISITL
jgi:hypothetical protein